MGAGFRRHEASAFPVACFLGKILKYWYSLVASGALFCIFGEQIDWSLYGRTI